MYQPRSHIYSTGAISALVGIALVLLFAPALERDAQVMTLSSGDADEILEAVRRLCWIESGREELDAVLPDLPLQRRVSALEAARELGCLQRLAPQLQATYLVWRPGAEATTEALLGLGASSLIPAVEALDAPQEEVRLQAIHVLGTLEGRMAPATRERVVTILRAQPSDPARDALLEQVSGIPVGDDAPASADQLAAEVVGDAVAISRAAMEAATALDDEESKPEEDTGAEEAAPIQPPPSLRLRAPRLDAPEGAAPGGVLFVRPPGDEPEEGAVAAPEDTPDEPATEQSDE